MSRFGIQATSGRFRILATRGRLGSFATSGILAILGKEGVKDPQEGTTVLADCSAAHNGN